MYLSLSLQHYQTYDDYSLPGGEPPGDVRLRFRASSGGCGAYVAGVFAPAFFSEHFLSFYRQVREPPCYTNGCTSTLEDKIRKKKKNRIDDLLVLRRSSVP